MASCWFSPTLIDVLYLRLAIKEWVIRHDSYAATVFKTHRLADYRQTRLYRH